MTTLIAADGVLLRADHRDNGVAIEEVRPGIKPELLCIVQEHEVDECVRFWAMENGIDVKPTRLATGLDSETFLIERGRLAPPLVCVSAAINEHETTLVHVKEAKPLVKSMLESDVLLVGANLAYDMAVFAAEWPEFIPLIFEVYWNDRISDVIIREKLQHIAMGVYRRFERADGDWVKLNYSLADISRRRLGIELEKGTWQLRFGELIDTPVAFWPQEAQQYAVDDSIAAISIWHRQNEEGTEYLEDEFRQSRAEWWLHLMSCWGLTTSPEGVREFARMTQQKYDAIADELVQAGVLRKVIKKKTGEFVKFQRNVKAVRERVVQAYADLGKPPPRVKQKKGEEGVVKNISTDYDACVGSKNKVLEQYAELSSLTHKLSNEIPLLESGVVWPIQARFETLLETGRTSSSPNVQNLPTEVGVRECFVPRPGMVYAIADYSAMELRTWAQFCLSMGWTSKMAEALNAGRDPHLEMAATILQISYEEAKAELKADPLGRVYLARQTSKVGNFGFMGGLGPDRFVEFARSNYGVTLDPDPERALEISRELRRHWGTAWPESVPFFEWVSSRCREPNPQLTQLFSNRVRGNLRFTEFANSTFQGLAADAAKHAGFLVSYACYADQNSVLFGSRIVNFVHDELVLEVKDDECAHDCAVELARLMCEGANLFIPLVPAKAVPLLARVWSKKAEPVFDENKRLIPWEMAA